MEIEVNGEKHEAFRLIMKKENALEILHGKKRLEIRQWNEMYDKMFFDKEKLALYREGKLDVEDPDIIDCLDTDTEYVYFTNYNNSWHLIVELPSIGINSMTKEDVEWMGEEFDFHDYDNEWQQFEGKPFEEIPAFFTLEMGNVIEAVGLE